MGRESNDPIVIQSSIALLQERFRRLQRVKEMREERELLKTLMEEEPNKQYKNLATMNYCKEPSDGLFFHFLPLRSAVVPHVPLFLSPHSEKKQADMESPVLMSLRPSEKPTPDDQHSPSYLMINKFDGSDSDDVDTSLHL